MTLHGHPARLKRLRGAASISRGWGDIDAVEPQPGIYNGGYLRKIRDYAELCEKNGIYIFLDMHQELCSNRYGDGAPGWATIAAGAACEKPLFVWAEGGFTGEAVHTAYEHF